MKRDIVCVCGTPHHIDPDALTDYHCQFCGAALVDGKFVAPSKAEDQQAQPPSSPPAPAPAAPKIGADQQQQQAPPPPAPPGGAA